ncbi:MAG TPA: ABC transporter substrate-binding protein [Candidatus Angelobacter sp.]|jgi:peptide/nickel transport system substrate-binding protein
MIIESSPANLDPRIGTDAQSERIDELIFDPLVHRDEHFNMVPWVAEKWEIPDPRTYIFHLRQGIHFHDGRPLTSRDVQWTLDSIRNGSFTTLKTTTYKLIDHVDAPNDSTVIIHLSEPDGTIIYNLSEGAFGIVPYGSDKQFSRNPIGSGPFRFVSQDPDSQVVLQRNDNYWNRHAQVENIRLVIVPDATTRALELRKGSADISPGGSLSADMIGTLRHESNLSIEQQPGTVMAYLAFNLRDPILKDVRVRQALAHAIDRGAMLHYLFGDEGRLADSVLPPQHWAYSGNVAHYPYDPAKANAMLDGAGYVRGKDGTRFHLTMKTSTEETTRLLAAVLQQQLQKVGIALDIRSFEFATFYSDVEKGSFQLYSLRWIGGNEDPDIFYYAFHSSSFPPKHANRSYYVNPEMDRLIEAGRSSVDQEKRKQIYAQIQQILARDLPYIDLWYFDNVVVHSTRVHNLHVSAAGNYDFLATVELAH